MPCQVTKAHCGLWVAFNECFEWDFEWEPVIRLIGSWLASPAREAFHDVQKKRLQEKNRACKNR